MTFIQAYCKMAAKNNCQALRFYYYSSLYVVGYLLFIIHLVMVEKLATHYSADAFLRDTSIKMSGQLFILKVYILMREGKQEDPENTCGSKY